jgi:hypothetical protein
MSFYNDKVRPKTGSELHVYPGVQVYNYSMLVDDIHEHLITHDESNFTTIMTKASYAQLFMLGEMFNFT